MSLQNSLHQTSPFGKIALLVLLMFLGIIVSIVALMAINTVFFHFPLDIIDHISATSSVTAINAAKSVQIATQIGIFILPAFAFAYLTSNSIAIGLKMNRRPEPQNIVFAILITLLAIPFINLLAQWNMDWHLPEAWNTLENWMRQTQTANDNMITVLAKMDSISDVLVNILMMAMLPAIGEELIFRGILQPQLIKIVKNPHVGIILTAIIFSAIHVQFLGFVSRAILGIIFGYLYFYSNNIRYPILAHFVNNSLALTLVYFFGTEMADSNFENPYEWLTIVLAIGTFILSIGLFALTKSQFIEESERKTP